MSQGASAPTHQLLVQGGDGLLLAPLHGHGGDYGQKPEKKKASSPLLELLESYDRRMAYSVAKATTKSYWNSHWNPCYRNLDCPHEVNK